MRTVIINTNPILCPQKMLCEAADTTVLVILSGEVTITEVKDTATDMVQSEVKILGCVMNDRDYPQLVDELCKATKQME